MNTILNKVANFVTVGDVIAVAVSGGVDSMVLLHAFSECKKENFRYFAVNVEHGIRGESSLRDSAFVADYCKRNSIELVAESFDVPKIAAEKGGTLEECAREVRYSVFNRLLNEGRCTKVALAHHLSDQAETILMRIIRGTGISGLVGMREVNGGFIRPLLTVSKEEILTYAKENSVPYVVDESNLDNNYTRNLLRNQVLTELKKLSLNAEEGLLRLSRIAAETEEYFESLDAPVIFDGDKVVLKINKDEPSIIFKRRLKKCFACLGVEKDIEEVHQNLLWDFRLSDNGRRLDMPYGVSAYKEYDSIVFARPKPTEIGVNIPFSIGKTSFLQQNMNIVKYCGEELKKGELLFDATKMPENAVFRRRKEGDRFTKFGGRSKSLGDFLTDKKVPLRERDSLIVCASGSDVLFIVGVEISNSVRVDFFKNTYDNIYKITLEA